MDSQQGVRNFSPTISWNWILPTPNWARKWTLQDYGEGHSLAHTLVFIQRDVCWTSSPRTIEAIWYIRHRRLLYKGFLEGCAIFCAFVCGHFSDERGYLLHQPCKSQWHAKKSSSDWTLLSFSRIVALNTSSSLRSRTFLILHIQLGKCVLWQTTSRVLFLSLLLTLRISKTRWHLVLVLLWFLWILSCCGHSGWIVSPYRTEYLFLFFLLMLWKHPA